MKLFRQAIFWCHLAAGVAAALVILIMSVTGVLLTYEKQITAWADARHYRVTRPATTASGDTRLTGPELLARAAKAEGRTPSAIVMRADLSAPAEVSFGRRRTLFVDPYDGRVLGDGSHGVRSFFHSVTDWHRWLAREGRSRDTGRSITGASNLLFLFLVVSGFYLWWPRNWSKKAVRNVTLLRRGLSPKARDFNWHNVFGFWMALPLLVIVASGVVISYPWASDLVFRMAGETPPPPRQGGPGGGMEGAGGRGGGQGGRGAAPSLDGLEPLWARAEGQAPGWRSISMQVPRSPEDPVRFTIDHGTGGQPQKRAQLSLDRATGEVVRWEPFSAGTRGRQWRSLLRFAHTGEVGGIAGQTIAGIASAAAALLVWTGLALAWRRLLAWRGRRVRAAATTTRPTAENLAASDI